MSLTFPKQKFASYCLPFLTRQYLPNKSLRNNLTIYHGHTILNLHFRKAYNTRQKWLERV